MSYNWMGKCVLGFILMMALLGFILMVLWNEFIPGIFNLPVINIWQSFGLLLISKILFKGGNGWMMGGRFKQHWKNKIENMNPEEREKFRAHWEQRCSKWGQKCSED